MKYIKALSFLFLIVGLASCQKEYSVEEPQKLDGKWEFFVDKVNSSGKVTTLLLTPGMLLVSGPTGDNTKTFSLKVNVTDGNITQGIYKTSTGSVEMDFMEGSNRIYTANKEIGEFTVSINLLTETFISGTFSGSVLGTDGKIHSLIQGKFSSPITPLTL